MKFPQSTIFQEFTNECFCLDSIQMKILILTRFFTSKLKIIQLQGYPIHTLCGTCNQSIFIKAFSFWEAFPRERKTFSQENYPTMLVMCDTKKGEFTSVLFIVVKHEVNEEQLNIIYDLIVHREQREKREKKNWKP